MTGKPFPEGARVYVKSLGKHGVVDRVLGDQRRIALGSLNVTVPLDGLEAARGPEQAAGTAVDAAGARAIKRRVQKQAATEIDLHGMTVDEAMRAVSTFLDRAIVADLAEVRIMHGLGSGRIQRALHEYLGSLKAVRHYKISEWNPGVTFVYF